MKPERTRRAAVAAMAKPRRPVHREKWPGYWKYSQKGQGHMDRGQELHFSRSVRNENGNQQEKERQVCQSRFPLRSQAGSSHGNGPLDEKAEKASGEEGPQDQEK